MVESRIIFQKNDSTDTKNEGVCDFPPSPQNVPLSSSGEHPQFSTTQMGSEQDYLR